MHAHAYSYCAHVGATTRGLAYEFSIKPRKFPRRIVFGPRLSGEDSLTISGEKVGVTSLSLSLSPSLANRCANSWKAVRLLASTIKELTIASTCRDSVVRVRISGRSGNSESRHSHPRGISIPPTIVSLETLSRRETLRVHEVTRATTLTVTLSFSVDILVFRRYTNESVCAWKQLVARSPKHPVLFTWDVNTYR